VKEDSCHERKRREERKHCKKGRLEAKKGGCFWEGEGKTGGLVYPKRRNSP